MQASNPRYGWLCRKFQRFAGMRMTTTSRNADNAIVMNVIGEKTEGFQVGA
jgi:hypothetical protein